MQRTLLVFLVLLFVLPANAQRQKDSVISAPVKPRMKPILVNANKDQPGPHVLGHEQPSAPPVIQKLPSLPDTIPAHTIKLDLLRSVSSRLHLDYEWYNSRHIGLQAGVNIFYPNRAISYINEDIILPTDMFAGHYKGMGAELKQSYYFNSRKAHPYLALVESYDYKHFEDADVFIVEEFRSSSYSYSENWSGRVQVLRGFVVAGYTTKHRDHCFLDFSLGFGAGHFDRHSTFNSTTNREATLYPWLTEDKGGHQRYVIPQLYAGVKLCFGIKK